MKTPPKKLLMLNQEQLLVQALFQDQRCSSTENLVKVVNKLLAMEMRTQEELSSRRAHNKCSSETDRGRLRGEFSDDSLQLKLYVARVRLDILSLSNLIIS